MPRFFFSIPPPSHSATHRSPERLKGQSYNFSADIWSLGITMLHCAMRGNPWLNMGVRERSTFFELLKLVDEGCLPELPDEYSHDARGFVASCLHVDAQLRPSAAKLLDQEVWLQGMTEDTAQSVTKAWVARLTQHVSSALSAATSPPHTDTDLSAINSVCAAVIPSRCVVPFLHTHHAVRLPHPRQLRRSQCHG